MRHNIENVAKHNRLPVEAFVKFATETPTANKFGVTEEGKDYFTVSTWYVNGLVDAAKKVIGTVDGS